MARLKSIIRAGDLGRILLLIVSASMVQACAANQGANGSAQLTNGNSSIQRGTQRDFTVNVGDIVYFTTDSSDINAEARQTLMKQVQWLGQYPQFTVTIEGHADERGTREYNLALGARRASSVRKFLMNQGVNGSRIRTISYGKERLVAVCNDLSCWSQNRRAQTVLNSRVAGSGS